MQNKLNLKLVAGTYGIAKLPPDADIPQWAIGTGFVSISIADDETTVVCLESRIPEGIRADRNWACIRTTGPFEFDAAGIVHSLITPLSTNEIGVFVVCTFDGEHLLVASKDMDRAIKLLKNAGHSLS